MSLFIRWPFLAFVAGLLFLGLYLLRRRRVTRLAVVAWTVYGLYEIGMQRRWLCSGECNIRVDLLLIYPVLAVVSLLALIGFLRGRSSHEPRSEQALERQVDTSNSSSMGGGRDQL